MNMNGMLHDYLEKNKSGTINKNILYTDMPKYFNFDKQTQKWSIREEPEIYCIGKFSGKHYNQETGCLQVLLHKIPGVSTLDELKAYEGKTFSSFFEAAKARKFI